ncbi:TfoX/Sxy family protein [Amycolatopsis sp. GM8]|uniref:TfoX/Sxy family protein n=1 Tax=Amycolatopsis sp. GM8 TaxID=2896530 RepID=UPI001F1B67B7|nr:TfoX/Sxy family protein [Amycolatopsis sp. GM8]
MEERFEELVDQFVGMPDVAPPGSTGGRFGSHALRVRSKIFAMYVRGQLVLKLPKSRVDELVAAGEGIRFDANKGTPMKEWLALAPESELPWHPLAEEAMTFVRG